MAGLVPAISLRKAPLCILIEIAGTSPAMTQERSGSYAALTARYTPRSKSR
jgi:hypothetical protein